MKTEQLRLELEKFELDKRERGQRMEHEAATLELIKKLMEKQGGTS